MKKLKLSQLKKLLAKASLVHEDERRQFFVTTPVGPHAQVWVQTAADLRCLAKELIEEEANAIAYLLNHAGKLVAIAEAFTDVMDGVKEHEINGMTGLPEERCKEIYKLAAELLI